MAKTAARRGATWPTLCKIALRLPGVELGMSYGTPALHVRKKFIARLKEDGETIAIRVDVADRDVLLEMDPAAFYVTDHYRPYPAMLIRLKKVRLDLLEQILERTWSLQAPKSLKNGGGRTKTRQRSPI
ncbi:MAG TPA: MmcQ/YjbR family DNA-binding protein [Candidatus Polarisedimenticolia bacterium]|nr:MmcQ/YjbR family DNA-binding protein [Candidatus Polarisedimenticolia bacterium]